MIEGYFRGDTPRLPLTLYDASGVAHTIDCIIDTGFVGELKLSPYWVGVLRLLKLGQDRFRLADGTVEEYELYLARGLWGDKERYFEVVEMVDEPLIGVQLLRGHRLVAEFDEGGIVNVEPL
ncbi:clan AA aspartic protease [Armatimonas sp.]|uniref:clan AA aspartic protease n=1 Tax=Armatimonas sp. TaxID=1872638 RepID=UPI003752B985